MALTTSGCGRNAGGEYEPQTGFGWSNGVVLIFLAEYGAQPVTPAPDGKM